MKAENGNQGKRRVFVLIIVRSIPSSSFKNNTADEFVSSISPLTLCQEGYTWWNILRRFRVVAGIGGVTDMEYDASVVLVILLVRRF